MVSVSPVSRITKTFLFVQDSAAELLFLVRMPRRVTVAFAA